LHQRQISRVTTVPKLAPGFVGPGHLAAPVIPSDDFVLTDPFVALMDDHLDIGNRPVGGPHPHAAFETVTLLLEGSIYDAEWQRTRRKSARGRALNVKTTVDEGRE
jgi:quercetin 2,3-dioxygenase